MRPFYLTVAILISSLCACTSIGADSYALSIEGAFSESPDAVELRLPSTKMTLTDRQEVSRFGNWLRSVRPTSTGSYPATPISVVVSRQGVSSEVVKLSLPIDDTVYVLWNGRLFEGPASPLSQAKGQSIFQPKILVFGREWLL